MTSVMKKMKERIAKKKEMKERGILGAVTANQKIMMKTKRKILPWPDRGMNLQIAERYAYYMYYSLFQKKRTFNSNFFRGPLGEGDQKFTWSIM